jgi:hypothetical protein
VPKGIGPLFSIDSVRLRLLTVSIPPPCPINRPSQRDDFAFSHRGAPRFLLSFERSTLKRMPYMIWINENNQPRVVAVMDKVFASTGATQQHTYEQFKKIVGKAKAEAAIRRYLRKQNAAA